MSVENFEKIEQEPQKYSSRISLKFFRHDEKEKTQPGQLDTEVSLTEIGKKHARGLSKSENVSSAIAFGSPSLRAQQTSAYVGLGEILSLRGDESLEEIKKIIKEDKEHHVKLGASKKLGFVLDKNRKNPYSEEACEAFDNGGWLKFLIERSDDLAKKYGDTESSTYSRQAAGIAQIVNKYLTLSPHFDSLVEKKGHEKDFKRFFGSHGGVLESFLAKIIEKTNGREELGKFTNALKGHMFDFAEGFEIDIDQYQGNGQPVVRISYEKRGESPEDSFSFNEQIDLDIIRSIIKEGSDEN